MGTTYSLTVGWGFQLTDEDIANLAKNLPESVWESYESGLDFLESTGEYETVDYAVRYGTDLNLFDSGMSAFYDYYDDEPYYIYLKRGTETFYSSGFNQLPEQKLILRRDETSQLETLSKILKRDVELVPFAEMSMG